MAEIAWSEPAVAQLDAILGYIALDKPEVAQAVASKVFVAFDKLARFPALGRPIAEFPHRNYRQMWVAPCWVYYRREKGRILILHVRRAEKLLRRDDVFAGEV